jgi:hypothetical protein
MPFQSLPLPADGDQWLDPAYFTPLADAWNGNDSVPASLTGMNDPLNYGVTVRNRGTGGRGLLVTSSVGGLVMDASDAGVNVTNLAASGAAAVEGTLTVGGATSLESTLDVDGATALGSTLTVADEASFGADVGIAGELIVGGATILQSTLNVALATTLGTTLDVMGPTHLHHSLTVDEAAELQKTLLVHELATFASGVNVVAGQMQLPAGTVTAPSLALGEPATGLFMAADDQIGMALGGVEHARLTVLGLGVGTTTARPPQKPLHAVRIGATPQAITTGTTVDDVAILEGPTAALNLIVPVTTGVAALRFSTPLVPNRGFVSYSEVSSELTLGTLAVVNVRLTSTTFGAFNTTPAVQQTGGVATAGAAYNAATQGMIQKAYDALRTFGFLT